MKKFAFLFPGQGSQSVGMLKDLYEGNEQLIFDFFQQASDILQYDLWSLVVNGPESKLNETHITQPALLVASVCYWHIWQKNYARQPQFLAGHSLGEYSALVCAKALSFSDAVELVAERGRLMQEAVPLGKGAMAAILGLEPEKVEEACQEAFEITKNIVTPANYNAIGQIVISGETSAVEKAMDIAKTKGAKIAKLLPVSVPSHSPLMEPAAAAMAQKLAQVDIKTPVIPVIHNVSVETLSKPEDIRSALVAQLYSPVRWVETIQRLVSEGVEDVFECGPGSVLTGLNKRIDNSLNKVTLEQVTA